MANTGSQAEAIRDLLIERLAILDSSLDTSEGSRAWNTVVAPVFDALGIDPFDVDIEAFLLARLRQEYPSLPAADGDAIVDLLIRPMQLLVEALKREIELLRKGQSVRTVAAMRDEDADALAANWFVQRDQGARAATVVRAFYAAPTFVNVTSTVTFSTSGGLKYFPTVPQSFSADQVLLQKSGSYYYVDVSIIAEKAGTEYNVAAGEISRVTGLNGAVRVSNLSDVRSVGLDAETSTQLLSRTQQSLTERTLNTRRGITARLRALFPGIRSIEVVGHGDPEMERDVLVGSGDGHAKAAGTCFVAGQFVLLFSQYEDRGLDGDTRIEVGDTINLNYWDLLYGLPADEAHEEFVVEDILLDGRDVLPALPGILLFRMSGVPSVSKSVLGMLPGLLPAVFCVVKGTGKITISDMPGGILDPQTTRGEVILDDNEVHVGGHYDTWIRPTADVAVSVDVGDIRSSSVVVEGATLITHGADDADKNKVEAAYAISYEDRAGGVFALGQVVTGTTSGATGTIIDAAAHGTAGTITLSGVATAFEEDEEISAPGVTATIEGIDPTLSIVGVAPGMFLSVVSGNDTGVYRVLAVDDIYAWLDAELTQSETSVHYRVLNEVVVDAFTPRTELVPFGAAKADDLQTKIGDTTVRVGLELLQYGVQVGDVLEILDGDDKGVYSIDDFDSAYGSKGPILSSAMSATNSALEYRVYRALSGLTQPLVRVTPGGVKLLDPSGEDSGYVVPHALPVGAYAKDAFSGAAPTATGLNGFVLPDPGDEWRPTGNLSCSRDEFEDATTCFTDECLDCDGYIACVSLMADGSFYLNSEMPTSGKEFFSALRTWLLSIVDTFDLGEDLKAFIHGLSPLALGAPVDGLEFSSTVGTFVDGETITGGTSGTTAAISSIEMELAVDNIVPSGTDSFFTDGETITGGTSGATASVVVTSEATVRLSSIVGAFVVDETITGGTTGVAADIDAVVGRLAVSGASGTFTDGETITGSTSAATATIDIVIVPVAQFEVCIPSEVFDGCNNVFVALPEFDWEATLGSADSLADAVTLYTQGDLNGDPPALASAGAGDALVLKSGANAGSYVIAKVYNYKLCTAAALVEGSADLDKCYPVTAVVIDGEFPVAPMGGLSSFFSDGIPDLSALPSPPDFPGVSYDESGIAQSPWEWVKLFLDWLLKLLVSLGFDLPSEVEIDTQELLKSLWQMLFVEYDVGKTTCEQYARVYFVEPTSFTARGSIPCALYTWAPPDRSAATLTGANFTLPMTWIEGMTAELTVKGLVEDTTLSAVLAGAGALDNTEDMAALLQTLLDPDEETVTFAAVAGPSGATGAISVTSVETGVDVLLALTAEDVTSAFRFLGFHDATGEEWSELSNASPPGFIVTHLSPSATDSFKLDITLGAGFVAVEVTVGAATDVSFRAMEDILETTIAAAMVVAGFTAITVEVAFVDAGIVGHYTVHLEGDNGGSGIAEFAIAAPTTPGLTDYRDDLFGGGVPANGTSTVTADTPMPFSSKDLVYTVAGVLNLGNTLTYSETEALDEAIGLVDYDALAIALNALDKVTLDVTSTDRLGWFVGGTELTIRTVEGNVTLYLVTLGGGFDALGFAGMPATDFAAVGTSNALAEGDTDPGTEVTETFSPPTPTLFSVPVGAQERLFVASGDADPYAVFPGAEADGAVAVTSLPRDIVVGSTYDDLVSQFVRFTDLSYESPLAVGIQAGSDWLYLYEQKLLLDAEIPAYSTDIVDDRLPALVTVAGSANVKLPSLEDPTFSFYAAESGDTQVKVGDLLFIEEGDDAGGYTVTARVSSTEITLDKAATASSGTIYRVGNDGVLVAGGTTIQSSTVGAFTADDVGRYVTIWAANRSDYDGSYEITAVDVSVPASPVATLNTSAFPHEAVNLHWAVVKAPTETPGTSGTWGRTELVGLRPFRVYKGTETKWRVADVSSTLDRATAEVTVVVDDGVGPVRGVNCPYQFVRPGIQRISSTTMAENKERGLYYVDVLAKSTGGEDLDNIATDTRMEPIFGTYDSDGWRLEVADNRLTFSAYESASMVFSPSFLPVGEADTLDAQVALENRGFRVTHDTSPLVGQIQDFLTSEADRVLCANPLARHFLPAYVYLDIAYAGGDSSADIAEDIRTGILELNPTDPLDISAVERVLHAHGVARYDHPVTAITLTHDLDRRVVMMKSDNRIGEDEVDFNGSNRTSFFIPGEDMSAETEDDIPDGERIYLTRFAVPTTLR